MRPIKLTITAFGSFAQTQIIDFKELGHCSFFLVHGPTGAGKTTILDAICYALYGETSGAERSGEQMRSHHAKPDLLTEVTFDFALGADVYRVKRSPKQEYKRASSGQTTVMQQKATLWKRNGLINDSSEGTVIAPNWKQVTARIRELFGFNSEQFRQVIMLPQGKFRQLLQASSADREQIFKTLFQTDLYERIEEALKSESRNLEEQLKEYQNRRKHVLSQAGAESEQELTERQKEMQDLVEEVGDKVSSLRETEQESHDRLRKGEDTARRITEKKEAESALVELEQRKDEFGKLRQELEVAQRASILHEAENALVQQQGIVDDAEKKHIQADHDYRAAVHAQQEATYKLQLEEQREQERISIQHEIEELQAISKKLSDLQQARRDLSSAEANVKFASQVYDAARKKKDALQKQYEEQLALLQDAKEIINRLNALRVNEIDLERAYQHRERLDKVFVEMRNAQEQKASFDKQLRELEIELSRARDVAKTIEVAWYEGQAAILAQGLKDDSPCPVCGSTHHPQPAKAAHELPSEQDLNRSRDKVLELEERQEEMRDKAGKYNETIIRLETEKATLQESLGDRKNLMTERIKAEVVSAKEERRKAEAKENEIPTLEQQTEGIRDELTLAETDITETVSHLHQAENQKVAIQTLVSERDRLIPNDLKDETALIRRMEELNHKLHDLQMIFELAQKNAHQANEILVASKSKLEELSEFATTARALVDQLSKQFQQRMTDSGFADETEYRNAKRSNQEMDLLDQKIREFDGKLQAAKERVKRAKEAAEGLVEPDLQALLEGYNRAKAELETAVRKEVELKSNLTRLTDWLAELTALVTESQKKEQLYKVIGKIAEVANGKNNFNITFHRFVLAALLDDVLIYASKRLQVMSRGRYLLQRAQSPADRRRTSGLDLVVSDTWTADSTRNVETLSGGESFYTALALALGLADVVQAYSGGLRLDTIFLDEGFGSLDSDSLDLAIQTLEGLREGGRLVGIISHVDSLRERIPARLEVGIGKHGSTAKFTI